ncbi:MAG: hypothetical protein HYS81_04790 [Candidatus Aenigmatarchaeota archaeon]|nr:MAG: hypothetical protein HYS81_04790 [Candidatus Aenigmarchaeota archaeon]
MHYKTFLIVGILLSAGCVGEKQEYEPTGNATIGYIGCSNTRETVEGYYHNGGSQMWHYDKRYDSGTVVDWARDAESDYWEVFDDLTDRNPRTKIIWWELCIMDGERETSYEHAAIVLDRIRERIPDAVIYVSPLAEYTDGVCEITGTWGLEKAQELASELDDKNEDVSLGPVLGPMTPEFTREDGCHLSQDGKWNLGRQLRKFFDAPGSATVGYIGCSNTRQTIDGYRMVGGTEIWEPNQASHRDYDSGSVEGWARMEDNFWRNFDIYLEWNPNTTTMWWELCVPEDHATPYEGAVVVLNEVRARIPGVTFYVTPLPDYTEGVCRITGTAGIERARALALELDERNEDVLMGPELGPMTPEYTDADGCHLTVEGARALGEQLKEFFG